MQITNMKSQWCSHKRSIVNLNVNIVSIGNNFNFLRSKGLTLDYSDKRIQTFDCGCAS